MNKNLFLFAAATTALVTSCVDDSVGEYNAYQNTDGRISFVQKVGNMTRATTQAQGAGHYEFGVWAMKGSALADYAATTNGVMGNYLVAYTDGTSGHIGYEYYNSVKANATTWGNAASGDVTDAATGVSSWFYEGITSSNHATYTTPEVNQILKYWDQAAANHYFFAYMPYNKTTSDATYNADKIAFSYDNTDGGKYVFTNLSSFYTSPVAGKQVANAANKNDGVTPTPGNKPYTNDNEILNDNEALYAYTAVAKANYGEDVPLEFKHINAKVNIAFYEVIKGYKVKLIDVVPASTTGPSGTLTAEPGVQFSPSTDVQSRQPMTVKQTTDLPKYYEVANVTAKDVQTNNATLSLTGTAVNKNLIFAATNATGKPSIGGVTEYIGEGSSTYKTSSATTLYVLPNYDGTKYITEASTTEYATDGDITSGGGTESNIADKTGYTLHVSYELIPEDGTAKTTVYDARVHVDAQYCKWQAGKAYTYIFKITNQTNGTTDPTTVDPAVGGTTPWVDPEDPRVPDDPALIPIVFDGVTVTDYDDANTGKVNETDEWVLTDPSSWNTFGTYRRSPAALTKTELETALSTVWTTETAATAGINAANCTFDGEHRVFTMSDASSNTFKWKATVQEVSSATFSAKYNGSVISDATNPPTATLYDYSLYVWDQDACSSATKYTAAPTGEVIYKTRTVVAKMQNTSSEILYKKSVAENGGPATETWYTDEACTTPDSNDHSDYTEEGTKTITYTNPTITYGSVSSVAASPVPAKAYAIVKVKP